jgi:DNA-binding NarL/FixJ family response regulator
MTKKNPETASAKARVLIVDDHPVVREGLAMHLAAQPDLEVCGEAEDLPGALALMASARPDVAIIDISLKNSNGIELIRRIRERNGEVRILVWSMYPESLYAERALRAGAQGYLTKGRATHHVLDAIRAILQGQVYVSGELANRLLQRVVGHKSEERSAIDTLSDRELEAFQLIGEGMTTESIAEKMHVSPKTVETFRTRIKEKLGISNLPELIRCLSEAICPARHLGKRLFGLGPPSPFDNLRKVVDNLTKRHKNGRTSLPGNSAPFRKVRPC